MEPKTTSVRFIGLFVLAIVIGSFAGSVLSAPVEKRSATWEVANPCSGSAPVSSILLPGVSVTAHLDSTTLDSLLVPLAEAMDAAAVTKNEIEALMGHNAVAIEYVLATVSTHANFPEPRASGSGQSTATSTVLTEDYKRISEIFMFVDEAATRRPSLDGLRKNLRQILCQVQVKGISPPSQISPDLAPSLADESRADQDDQDYVMVTATITVLRSLHEEYKALTHTS